MNVLARFAAFAVLISGLSGCAAFGLPTGSDLFDMATDSVFGDDAAGEDVQIEKDLEVPVPQPIEASVRSVPTNPSAPLMLLPTELGGAPVSVPEAFVPGRAPPQWLADQDSALWKAQLGARFEVLSLKLGMDHEVATDALLDQGFKHEKGRVWRRGEDRVAIEFGPEGLMKLKSYRSVVGDASSLQSACKSASATAYSPSQGIDGCRASDGEAQYRAALVAGGAGWILIEDMRYERMGEFKPE
jgi:hypothetical protein